MKTKLNILFVEDSADDMELMLLEIEKKNIKAEWKRVENKKDLLSELNNPWDIIISDYVMPGFSGPEVLEIVRGKNELLPIIIVSGTVGEDVAVDTLKLGANDYLMKSNLKRLVPSIERAVAEYKIKLKNVKIEQENKIFAHALRGISDSVTMTDLENNLFFVNNAFLRNYGYREEEVLGKKMDMFRPSKNPTNIDEKILEETLTGGWKDELWNKRKDGTEFQILLSSSVIKNEHGKTVALLGISNDITERKHAELLQSIILNISQAANTDIYLNQLIGIIKVELQKIIDIKNFFVALYDETTDVFTSPYTDDDKDAFIESWAAGKTLSAYVLKNKKPILLSKDEILLLAHNGDIEIIGTVAEMWMGVPLIVKGKPFGVFAIQNYENTEAYNQNDLDVLEFISHQMSISIERKRAEEELVAAKEKAEESDRLKSAFLATMSHELRTPLNAIIGFSDLIKENKSLDQILTFAGIVNRSGRHLLEIVEEIFDVTLLEIGQFNVVKEKHNLSSIMQLVQELSESEREKKRSNIELIYKPDVDDDNLFVFTDKSKLKQILLNLLKNALKFTHKGYIEYGYTRVIEKDTPLLRFYIKDTGIGIAKDKQEFIFNIFRQADETLTRYYGGTGIGLFIVKRFTEILGGRVDLKSEVGKGSEFSVTIPYVEPKKIKKEDSKNTESSDFSVFLDKLILIVEDDYASTELLIALLNEKKIKHIEAHNGEEAVKICSENKAIDFVLMDLKMPVMNGYQACRKIKKIRPELTIIAQSAHALDKEIGEAYKAGCNDFITKPIDQNKLYAILSKVLK